MWHANAHPPTHVTLKKAVTLPATLMSKHSIDAHGLEVVKAHSIVSRALISDSCSRSDSCARSDSSGELDLMAAGCRAEAQVLASALRKARHMNRNLRFALEEAHEREALAREREAQAVMSSVIAKEQLKALEMQVHKMRRDLLERSLLLSRAAAAVPVPLALPLPNDSLLTDRRNGSVSSLAEPDRMGSALPSCGHDQDLLVVEARNEDCITPRAPRPHLSLSRTI